MRDDVILTQAKHDQLISLIDQLVEVSIWQDAQSKSKDPLITPGESFMTHKLKLVRDTLLS
jgi:hypothetical protein